MNLPLTWQHVFNGFDRVEDIGLAQFFPAEAFGGVFSGLLKGNAQKEISEDPAFRGKSVNGVEHSPLFRPMNRRVERGRDRKCAEQAWLQDPSDVDEKVRTVEVEFVRTGRETPDSASSDVAPDDHSIDDFGGDQSNSAKPYVVASRQIREASRLQNEGVSWYRAFWNRVTFKQTTEGEGGLKKASETQAFENTTPQSENAAAVFPVQPISNTAGKEEVTQQRPQHSWWFLKQTALPFSGCRVLEVFDRRSNDERVADRLLNPVKKIALGVLRKLYIADQIVRKYFLVEIGTEESSFPESGGGEISGASFPEGDLTRQGVLRGNLNQRRMYLKRFGERVALGKNGVPLLGEDFYGDSGDDSDFEEGFVDDSPKSSKKNSLGKKWLGKARNLFGKKKSVGGRGKEASGDLEDSVLAPSLRQFLHRFGGQGVSPLVAPSDTSDTDGAPSGGKEAKHRAISQNKGGHHSNEDSDGGGHHSNEDHDDDSDGGGHHSNESARKDGGKEERLQTKGDSQKDANEGGNVCSSEGGLLNQNGNPGSGNRGTNAVGQDSGANDSGASNANPTGHSNPIGEVTVISGHI